MINICFHGIGTPRRNLESDEADYWISAALYLQIIEEIEGRDDVAVSFDDGNSSDLDIGLGPLLDSGRSAAFFVLAGRLDQSGSLARDDIRTLHQHGMIIGSHGMDHIPWRHLSEDRQHRELVDARQMISDVVNQPISEAALPLGRYDRRVLTALRRAGYDRVYSSDRRRTKTGAWLQPRYSVHAEDTIESVRREILEPPALTRNAVSHVKGVIKRLR